MFKFVDNFLNKTTMYRTILYCLLFLIVVALGLSFLEKLVRLHYHLDINVEGIDAITNLLQRMANMHHEILQLKSRLQLYEAAY